MSELRGRTLKVYLYLVRENRPVGPRDVMRGLSLSSPSVAYRHLQKLEDMNLLKKQELGNYVITKKISIKGYLWIKKRLIPNSLFYFILFLSVLLIEVVIFLIHFSVETNQFKIFFFLLMLITIAAMILFLFEGLRGLKKIRITNSN
ncbi:MAG: hypothetical protein P8Y18_06125 [Candidatus Bathyarchaeota archaeon]